MLNSTSDPGPARAAAQERGLRAPGPPSPSERRALAWVLALFSLLSLVHLALLPAFEGPDEIDNLAFVRYLVLEQRLPQPTVDVSPELELLGRGHMPPLWFLCMTPLAAALGGPDWVSTVPLNPAFLRRRGAHDTGAEREEEVLADPFGRLHYRHGAEERREWRGALLELRLLRLLNLPCALVALWATWRAGRLVFPERTELALWSTALLAATPQWQHLSATLTMDLMLAAWGSLATWALLEWCVGRGSEVRAASLAGLTLGLCALTKLNGLVPVPLLAVAAWLARANGRGGPRAVGAALGAFACSAGPYYVWGWIESGHPLWNWQYQNISPFHASGSPPGVNVGLIGPDLAETARRSAWFASVLFLTWIGDFGWTSVWFPGVVVLLFALLYFAGAVGWAQALWCARRARLRDPRRNFCRAALLLLSAGCLGMFAAEIAFNLRFSQPQARHLYPLVSALVLCLGSGLARWRLLVAAVLAQVLLSLAGLWLVAHWLRPAGWNHDPRWAATDAERAVLASPVERVPSSNAPRWSEPASTTAPLPPFDLVLRWEARPGAHCDLVVAVDNPQFEHRPWAPRGYVFRALRDMAEVFDSRAHSAVLPASFSSELPPGSKVFLQVLELDEAGRAVARSAVLELQKPFSTEPR